MSWQEFLTEEQLAVRPTIHVNRVTAIGITKKNKEETKHQRQIAKRSRRINRK
jgi:hypothetical protein